MVIYIISSYSGISITSNELTTKYNSLEICEEKVNKINMSFKVDNGNEIITYYGKCIKVK